MDSLFTAIYLPSLEHTVIGYVNSTIKTESGEEKTKEIPLSRSALSLLAKPNHSIEATGKDSILATKILATLILSSTVLHDTLHRSLGLGSVISFEIPLDGYTNLPSGNTNSIRGFSIFGDKNSHQYRLQHSLWNSLRIYQSFAYLPLLAPPGEFVPDSEDKPPSSGPASVERLDLEEIELSTSSSTVESPPPSLKPSGDVYTVHSGNSSVSTVNPSSSVDSHSRRVSFVEIFGSILHSRGVWKTSLEYTGRSS